MGIFRRPRTTADALLLAAALVAVALLAFVSYGTWQVSRTLGAVSSDPLRDFRLPLVPAADAGERQPGLAGAFARGDRVNLLLLGYGGAGHDGAYLTDSLMLASIDGRSGAVTLVSIPRDLWVTIPKGKYNGAYQAKVNEAFAVGGNRGDRDEGMRLAAAAVSDVVGLPIGRTVAIDFRAFRTVVDRIGGIDVTVDRSFASLYPASDSATDDRWIEVAFKAGPQHMDGETALRYSRARYADGVEGSDFARSARQQKVILATRDKVAATGAAQSLLGLLDALRDNVRTDLSLADMRALADVAKDYDDASTVKAALTNHNVLQNYSIQFADGLGFTLQPRVDGWGGVREYVRRLVDFPASLREDPLVTVRATRARAEAGAEAVRRLEELGFRARFEQAEGDDPPSTLVAGSAVASVGFLASFFGGGVGETAGAVVARLGRDWVPPRPFALRVDIAIRPAPSPSRAPSPSLTPSPSPTRSPAPSGSALPSPTPNGSALTSPPPLRSTPPSPSSPPPTRAPGPPGG